MLFMHPNILIWALFFCCIRRKKKRICKIYLSGVILLMCSYFYWQNSYSFGRKLQALSVRHWGSSAIYVPRLSFTYELSDIRPFLKIHLFYLGWHIFIRLLFEFYLFACDEEVIWKRNNHSVNVKGCINTLKWILKPEI